MLLFKGQATEHRTVRINGLLVSKLKGIQFTCASHHSAVSQIGNFTDLCNICNPQRKSSGKKAEQNKKMYFLEVDWR